MDKEIKRPEKKEILKDLTGYRFGKSTASSLYCYNQACEEWESYHYKCLADKEREHKVEMEDLKCRHSAELRRVLDGLIKEMEEKRNPYPESVFKGADFKFYRQIYDNSRIEMIEIITEAIQDIEPTKE